MGVAVKIQREESILVMKRLPKFLLLVSHCKLVNVEYDLLAGLISWVVEEQPSQRQKFLSPCLCSFLSEKRLGSDVKYGGGSRHRKMESAARKVDTINSNLFAIRIVMSE